MSRSEQPSREAAWKVMDRFGFGEGLSLDIIEFVAALSQDHTAQGVSEDAGERAVAVAIEAELEKGDGFEDPDPAALARAAIAALSSTLPSQDLMDEVREVLEDVLSHRVGDLPTRGYLRDNDRSRASIGRLANLLTKIVTGLDKVKEDAGRPASGQPCHSATPEPLKGLGPSGECQAQLQPPPDPEARDG